MKIKIVRYRKVDSGSLKGVAQVLFEDIGLTVNGIKVINTKKGATFYGMPSEKYTDRNTNEEKYRDHCGFFEKGAYTSFAETMNQAFKAFFAEEQQQIAPNTNFEYPPLGTPVTPMGAQTPLINEQEHGLPF